MVADRCRLVRAMKQTSRRAKCALLSNMNVEGKVVARKRGAVSNGGTNVKKEEDNKIPRSTACCARCRNHGLRIPVKGHKRYCRFYDCVCMKCQLTADRQRVLARQTKMQRDMVQDEKKVLAPGEVDPRPRSIDTDYGSSHSGQSGRVKVESSINFVSDLVNESIVGPLHAAQPQIRYRELFLEYSMKLLHLLGYPWVCLTFVYLIVKESGGNLDKAVRRIAEANSDIRALDVWNASEMKIQSDISLSGTPLPQVDTVGAPTYVGQVPYIGVVPPPGAFHLGAYSQLMPVPKVSHSPDTPSEHSTM